MIKSKDINYWAKKEGTVRDEVIRLSEEQSRIGEEYQKMLEIKFLIDNTTHTVKGIPLEVFEHSYGSHTVRALGEEIEREAELKKGKSDYVLILKNGHKEDSVYDAGKPLKPVIQLAIDWVVEGKRPQKGKKNG